MIKLDIIHRAFFKPPHDHLLFRHRNGTISVDSYFVSIDNISVHIFVCDIYITDF